ncbi:MAG: hypothetical protein Wins2KO_22690 [Winogradskyella sp.]
MIAQQVTFNEAKPFLKTFQNQVIIPNEFHFHSVQKVQIDSILAYLFRYQKNDNDELRGQHFSFIVSENEKKILGFTNMDIKYSNCKMISKAETEIIARDFLLKMDAKLFESLENLWIAPHNEELILNNDKTAICGMKYKCFSSSNNDYAWVIVGFNGEIITYERDIKWNSEEKKRITHKWLHDNWVNSITNNI